MIRVRLLNGNTISILESDEGKPTIRSSSGLYYHNPNELLCCAIGACIGRHIVIYFTNHKLDIAHIKELQVGFDGSFIINLKYYNEIESYINDIEALCISCEVVRKLVPETKFNALRSDEPYVKIEPKQKCCGDR